MPDLTCLAYIDPMSGAIILQVILAGAVGCAAFFRRAIWAAVRRLSGRKTRDESAPERDAPDAGHGETHDA